MIEMQTLFLEITCAYLMEDRKRIHRTYARRFGNKGV